MLRALALRMVGRVPPPVKNWLYRHPRVLGPLARGLKRMVPADAVTTVTIPHGPLAGMKLAVDRQTPNYYWLDPTYEADVTTALSNLVRPGMTVADVGAHIGYDTLLLARLVGDAGRVIAFEPDPANLARLRRNCEINGLTRVTVDGRAVCDRPGAVQLAARGETTSHLVEATPTTIANDSGSKPEVLTVDGVTLDDLFADQPLGFVKIDVEDAEVMVLRGASRVLATQRPPMIIEVHTPESLAGCVGILSAAGYQLRALPQTACYQKTIETAGREVGPGFERGHLVCVAKSPIQ
jgi:FkbM family methyltransferase